MTDNSKFKEEARELLNRLMDFRRKYLGGHVYQPTVTAPNVLFEAELRMMLMIARTDDENEQQKKSDSFL